MSKRETLTRVDQSVRQHLPQAARVGVCGSDHRQVAVQTDEGQDEHAAVQVDRVDDVHAHAGHRAEAPVRQRRVRRPERKRQNKEQIGGRQVQSVAVGEAGFGPETPAGGEDSLFEENVSKGRGETTLTYAGSPTRRPPNRSR